VDPTAGPLISVGTDDAQVAAADLIIETVMENIAVKSATLSRIEPYLKSQSIIVSNSWSLPMTQLSEALQNPGKFCGIHFCHPVSESP